MQRLIPSVCVSLLEYVYRDFEKVSWHLGAEQLLVYLILNARWALSSHARSAFANGGLLEGSCSQNHSATMA